MTNDKHYDEPDQLWRDELEAEGWTDEEIDSGAYLELAGDPREDEDWGDVS